MKIVLDANVIIAGFAARGLCESILEVCLSEHEIVFSDDLLDEILRNLRLKIKLPDLAVASNADYIVTGDKDLLVLKSFQNIPILTPRSFSDILHGVEK
jgi:predicted nucleic acid-binding protein